VASAMSEIGRTETKPAVQQARPYLLHRSSLFPTHTGLSSVSGALYRSRHNHATIRHVETSSLASFLIPDLASALTGLS
jgi:hypothetical protein